jgi:hypothetical protein
MICKCPFYFCLTVPILTKVSQCVITKCIENEKESAYHEEKKCDKLNKILYGKE